MIANNKTLLSTISDKAAASATPELLADAKFENDKEGFKRWETHWCATGKQWASELRAEGLVHTAEAVEKHVAYFERNEK